MVSPMALALSWLGVQLVSLNSEAGVDTGDLCVEDVADLFGTDHWFQN